MTVGDERTRRIQAALDDFYETLARVPVVGVTGWSELDRLTELITHHPEAARRILDELDAARAD